MRFIVAAILVLSAIGIKQFGAAFESVAAIELNHFYDQRGNNIYDQVIFYEKSPEDGRLRVRSWCLVDDAKELNRRPVKNYNANTTEVDWYDTDNKILRKISSRIFRESWTQIDPERENKKVLHESLRLALIKKVGSSNGQVQEN
jgi:hypothetical protein